MLVDEKRLANVLTALETGGRTITLDLAADLRDARARLAALEAQAATTLALLSRLQWDVRLRCPVCHWARESGHVPECALAEAVRREP